MMVVVATSLAALLVATGCVSTSDFESAQRQISELQEELANIKRTASSKEEVQGVNVRIAEQTETLLKSNATLVAKVERHRGAHPVHDRHDRADQLSRRWRDAAARADPPRHRRREDASGGAGNLGAGARGARRLDDRACAVGSQVTVPATPRPRPRIRRRSTRPRIATTSAGTTIWRSRASASSSTSTRFPTWPTTPATGSARPFSRRRNIERPSSSLTTSSPSTRSPTRSRVRC